MEKRISCCGTICSECEFYPADCQGCEEIEGKVFWLEYTEESVCDTYDCCRKQKKYAHCGQCGELPCSRYERNDPTKTLEENEADHCRQMKNLREYREIDIKDMSYSPSIKEIGDYIGLPLFRTFCYYMDKEYQAIRKSEYSKDVWARGWNVKFRKAGKSLCVIYPKVNYFTVLVVVGAKEKARVEKMLPYLSKELQELYRNTKEGNGQRWLMIDLHSDDGVYQDVLQLIRIRRESK